MSDSLIVAVFGASKVESEAAYDSAVHAGALLAKAGFTVATGGYGGVMEAAAQGAADAGGDTVGFTAPAVFPGREGANSHIATEITTDTLSERIHRIVDNSAAFLVLPGSIGTLAELMVAWNSAFVTRYSGLPAKPVAAVGEPWSSLVPHLAEALATDASLVSCHHDVAAAVAFLEDELG